MRLRAFAALRKRGYLYVFAPLRDNALAGWLRTEARDRGIDIKPDAAAALATLAGPDLGRLSQALEQLGIYVGGERAIAVDDVEDLVAETREHAIFELTKAIGMGDVPQSLALLRAHAAQPGAAAEDPVHAGAPAAPDLARQGAGRRRCVEG